MKPEFQLAGYPVFHAALMGSTQAEARQFLEAQPKADRAVFWADAQSAGRGRTMPDGTRTWESPPGNLYFSMVRRLNLPAPVLARLPLVVGYTCLNLLERGYPLPQAGEGQGEGCGETALRFGQPSPQPSPASGRGRHSKAAFGFKWPNDLLLNMKKYGGILLESRNGRIIIGIGLNLMGFPPNTAYPATCLAAAGIAAKPADLLKTLVPKLDAALIEGATAEGWDRIRKALGPKLAHTGGQIRVQGPREAVEGICEGLAEDGALMLRLKDGTQRMIHSGEVFDALGH